MWNEMVRDFGKEEAAETMPSENRIIRENRTILNDQNTGIQSPI